jgi:hypothetical protein
MWRFIHGLGHSVSRVGITSVLSGLAGRLHRGSLGLDGQVAGGCHSRRLIHDLRQDTKAVTVCTLFRDGHPSSGIVSMAISLFVV